MNGYAGGALFMTVGCLVFYGILVRGLVAHRRMRRAAVRVPGVVLDLRPTKSGSTRAYQYAPVLEFRTVEGKVVQTVSPASSNPPVAQPGETVEVAYDPAEPANAHVDTIGGSGVLVYLAGLALTTLVFAIAVAILLNSW